MFADKLKFLQGYVKVRLTGYAPERFLNLCSNRNILIWNLEYREEHYEFCISLPGFRQLKPILRKTKTRLLILERFGLPFWMHRYRKRKIFFFGILLCSVSLYVMSLFIWNIQVEGNLHRTDSAIIKFLEEHDIYHGILKSRLDCAALEELLRSEYDDVIWASAKIQGTRLIIEIQENLATNQERKADIDDAPSDLIAQKDGEIYSIFTRRGTPYVEKGTKVQAGDMLVEGKLPIYNDSGEIVNYQYCPADADILAVTEYSYDERFSMTFEDKVFTGNSKKSYQLGLFGKLLRLPFGKNAFQHCDKVTTELPLKLGESFYLPIVLYTEESKEYVLEKKKYTKQQAEALAEHKLAEFCKKLEQKGVQIIENSVMIVTEANVCTAAGTIRVIEPMGKRQATSQGELAPEAPTDSGTALEERTGLKTQQEEQSSNESD